MEPHDVVTQNLRAWNEVAPRHAQLNFERTRDTIASSSGHYLDADFRDYLVTAVGLEGKTVAQFNCNNGRELISAVQLGARKGYGFDFSKEFLEQARILASVSDADVEFVETNIYEMPRAFDAQADILILTSGALCWMPDLRGYFEVARRVLRPGGALVIYETHPFLEMFKLDRERSPGESLVPHYSYFMNEPVKSTNGLDYYSNTVYGKEVVYWYHHTISEIMQSIIDAGFAIRRFREFEHDSDSGYASIRELEIKLPMSYLLHASK